jgi:protein transport protein SEC61 subunit alpha
MWKLIYLVKPVMAWIPEVEQPVKKQMFKEKMMWTATVLFIYLICCQIPLYGTVKQEGSDPLYWLRVILASNKGTLMELGISPIITSSMIMQLLQGTKIIDVNMRSQMDRDCFGATTNCFGFVMAVGEALAYMLSGMYG